MSDTSDTQPDRGVVTTAAPTATSVAFVAPGQLPPLPPPAGETGIRKWVHENLFPDWLNGGLTILSLAFLAWILPGLIDWVLLNSVWNAGSLDECRQIMDREFGEGVRGACWAVVNERFPQFLYGFYPVEERWRANLAAALLLVAFAPVLFSGFPGRRLLLAFTFVYPAVAYFLIWGGSIWPLVTLLIGGALALFTLLSVLRSDHPVIGTIGVALAVGIGVMTLFGQFLWGPMIDGMTARYGTVGFPDVESDRLGGFLLTLIIGVTAISASLPIGVMLALGRQSGLIFIKMVSVIVIEAIRGVPLITLLFVASTLLNYFLPPGTQFDIVLRVIILATLFSAAYIAEAVRGGLAALPKGQYEAADAMGLTYAQSMRLIILPQALKISIPSIVNIFIGLFKDTTLVSIIGLLDPLGIIQPILADSNWQGIIAELYVFVAVFFFFFCFGMSRYSMYLERKLKTDRN